MGAWLEKGNDIYEIADPVTTMGRDEANDVVLSIDLISRVHAMIYEKNGQHFIRDLGSLNGTRVNGTKIDEDVMLKDGDVVTVGFELTFRTGEWKPSGRQQARRPSEAYKRRTQEFPGSSLNG
jgi:pSer/pThr/pTyr-binding forkhead associated (FHA) protein